MKKIALAAALSAAFVAAPGLASAQSAAPAAKSDFTFTGNAGLFSDYRFRGYSQTGYKPAFQGGFDLAHSSGLYIGNWNSNVEQDLYTGASLEMDFYGGYKNTIGAFGYDVGYLYYYYPNSGAGNSTKIKNGELYVGGSVGPVSLKWYYATTKFFSLDAPGADTKGSWYLDLTGTFDLGNNLGLITHYGYQKIQDGKKVGLRDDNVGDWKVALTYDWSSWIIGAGFVGTTKKDEFVTAESGGTEGAGKTRLLVSLSKTF